MLVLPRPIMAAAVQCVFALCRSPCLLVRSSVTLTFFQMRFLLAFPFRSAERPRPCILCRSDWFSVPCSFNRSACQSILCLAMKSRHKPVRLF
jgi:hypothetical protein